MATATTESKMKCASLDESRSGRVDASAARLSAESSSGVPLLGMVAAGFPSPAEAYREEPLDLNQLLVRRPAATFFLRAAGDSMINAGIHDGDILVVDRSRAPRNHAVVIAELEGNFTVKYLEKNAMGAYFLVPANPRFQTIALSEGRNCDIFGVVTAVIHQFPR